MVLLLPLHVSIMLGLQRGQTFLSGPLFPVQDDTNKDEDQHSYNH